MPTSPGSSDEETSDVSDEADTVYPDEMSEVTEHDMMEAEALTRRAAARSLNVRFAGRPVSLGLFCLYIRSLLPMY